MSSAPGKYCKGLILKDLRGFPALDRAVIARHMTVDDEAVFYIHDNYVVRDGILTDDAAIFDDVTDEWKSFCHEKLGFAIPDYQLQNVDAKQGA